MDTRGLELADRYPGAAYWRGTLLLNLGEWQWEAALYYESFVNCRARSRRAGLAPWASEEGPLRRRRALRALGRSDEAIPFLEEALAWAEAAHPDWPMTEQFRAELEAARDG